jgi:hypothetical protein
VYNAFDDIFVAFKKLEANFIIPFENIPNFPRALCLLGLIADAESQIRSSSKVIKSVVSGRSRGDAGEYVRDLVGFRLEVPLLR